MNCRVSAASDAVLRTPDALSQEQAPFDLPPRLRWGTVSTAAVDAAQLCLPATMIGGNSGSPVVDRDGKVVGLNFDSNLEKLPNRYYYLPDETGSRAIAVQSVAILAARTLYGAGSLADKLTGQTPSN